MNHQSEVYQLNDAHFGEVYLPQHIVVMVVGHYVACVGHDGTVNKLVVITVSGNKIEMESRINQFYVPAFHESINVCFYPVAFYQQILVESFGGDAESSYICS